jgi:hypothetical protein
MRTRSLLAITSALMGSAALTPVTAFAGTPVTCSQLATLLKANAYITQTSSDNQGIASPTATIVAATSKDAAYCNVQFQFSAWNGPTYGYAVGESQTIGIGIGLPLNGVDGGTPSDPTGYTWTAVNGAWNGKVENLGGGGLAGSVGSTTQSTDAGYVGSSTDGGHNSGPNGNGSEGNFAVIQATHQLDIGKITDLASESIHQQYVWALWLANKYYGQSATRNYWYGCSTGGRQGMELAQEWGYDFDGFVVGAPVVYWNNFDLAHGWAALVNRDDVVGSGDSAFTTAQYNNASAHATAACDVEGLDTVADGIVDDPRQCKYTASGDPTILSAPAGTCTGANCLDLTQAAAIDKIWADAVDRGGPRNHDGQKLWFGWMPTVTGMSGGVGPAIPTGALSITMVYDWDHRDLTASASNIYSSRALAAANPLGEPNPIALEDEFQINDTPPGPGVLLENDDYQGIIDNVYNGPKHGKIIHWNGVNDTNVWFQSMLHYYRAAATTFGNGTTDYTGLQSFWRYYHAPGVGHCGGGIGASPLLALGPDGNPQMFDDLVNWVENGVPPQSAGDSTHAGILATSSSASVGSRPICPWPSTAVYTGTGSTTVASNYTCSGNLDAYPPTAATNNVATICALPLTVYGEPTSNSLDYKALGITAAQCPNP